MTVPHPRLRQAINRYQDASSARVAEAETPGFPYFGDVASVTPGAGVNGTAAITITWFGRECPAQYVNSYTPQLGDRVAFGYDGKQIIVVGKSIG